MNSQDIFYVYLHKKADSGEVFYVGKGSKKRAYKPHGRSELWTRIAKKHGFIVEIIKDSLSEEDAFQLERDTILKYESLCNFTLGGEGCCGLRHSEETRALLSQKLSGRKQSKEEIANRAKSLKGKKRSKEFSEWLSRLHTGRKATEETKQKMRLARIGLKRSQEAIDKCAAWHKGKKRGEQARLNMSNSQKKTPVMCIETGNVFSSLTLAAAWLKSIGFDKASKAGIWSAVGKDNRTYHGYKWIYVDAAS